MGTKSAIQNVTACVNHPTAQKERLDFALVLLPAVYYNEETK